MVLFIEIDKADAPKTHTNSKSVYLNESERRFRPGIHAPPGPRTARCELVRDFSGFCGPGAVRSWDFKNFLVLVRCGPQIPFFLVRRGPVATALHHLVRPAPTGSDEAPTGSDEDRPALARGSLISTAIGIFIWLQSRLQSQFLPKANFSCTWCFSSSHLRFCTKM